MSGSKRNHYQLFGLWISSDIELSELASVELAGEADVSIRLHKLPMPQGKSDEVWVERDGASFFIDGVAHYRVSAGHEILVDPHPTASARNVRLFLLGSAMGLLLHQRGNLPLHANAIEIGGRAYAFMGPSGAGKSTLAAAFHDKGYRIVADDVCVVSFGEDEQPCAHGGVPRLRLWEDALTATGRSAADYDLSYAGDEQYRKFDVPTQCEPGPPVPMAAIVELAPGDDVSLLKLDGVDAIEAVFANTYRGGFVALAGEAEAHWKASLKLVSAVPVYRLRRPLTLDSIIQIVGHFESDQCPSLVE